MTSKSGELLVFLGFLFCQMFFWLGNLEEVFCGVLLRYSLKVDHRFFLFFTSTLTLTNTNGDGVVNHPTSLSPQKTGQE